MENILNKLTYLDTKFPEKELNEAINHKDVVTPLLLNALDELNENIEISTKNPDYMLHIYAMFLLAQFREKSAFKKIIQLVSHSTEDIDAIFGDVLTEDLPSLLYSTFDGDLTALLDPIENPLIDGFVKSAILDVYGQLYVDDVVDGATVTNYIQKLVQKAIQEEDRELGTSIGEVVMNYHLIELMDDVQHLYDANCIDELLYGNYDEFVEFIFNRPIKGRRAKYIENTIDEMEWWACFEQPEKGLTHNENRLIKDMHKSEAEFNPLATMKSTFHTQGKIGRNDPCPCGSGKKYKRCCINKEVIQT